LGFRVFISIAVLAVSLSSIVSQWRSEPEPTIWFQSHQGVMEEAWQLQEGLGEYYVASKASINRAYVAFLHQQRTQVEREWNPSQHLSELALTQNPRLSPSQARSIATAIVDSADRHEVDPFLVAALISQESKFRPQIVSPGGAVGLGQLLPATAYGLGVDPYSPAQNVEGCVRYLKIQLNRWNGQVDLALASYNAGPGAVQQHGGVPPYRVTRNYVAKISGRADRFRRSAQKARDRWIVANGPRMVDIYGRKVTLPKRSTNSDLPEELLAQPTS
jgi:hypothetical protein